VVRALDSDLPAMLDEAKSAKDDVAKAVKANWQTLGKIRLVSPQSTTPAEQLRRAARLTDRCEETVSDGARFKDCVDEAFKERLAPLRKALEPAQKDAAKPPPFLHSHRRPRRPAGRRPGETSCAPAASTPVRPTSPAASSCSANGIQSTRVLSPRACGTSSTAAPRSVKLDSYPYLRGLDGATLEGVPNQPKRVNDSGRGGNAPQIEWPEGRDQRDYVRRLAQQIFDGIDWYNPESQVRAIGLIGSDVHDKLVLVQALREAFPDRMVFTTDLDARLLHPSVTRYNAQPHRRLEPAAGISQLAGAAVPRHLPDCHVSRRAACRGLRRPVARLGQWRSVLLDGQR
jgi:hypothetical protein